MYSVVKPDNTVERRNLETGGLFEGKRIVKSGLKGRRESCLYPPAIIASRNAGAANSRAGNSAVAADAFKTRAETINCGTRNSECGMSPIEKSGTKAFALRILKLVDALPKTTAGRALASQIVRSGTSVAANYRAACRGEIDRRTSLPRWVSSKRKQMKLYFWARVYSKNLGSFPCREADRDQREVDELIAITVCLDQEPREGNPPADSAFRTPNSAFE